MPNDIRDFLNQVKSKGIARPNMFRVIGDIGPFGAMNARNEAVMCRSASIPAMETGEIVIPYRGPQVKAPGDRTFGDWDLTFISDEAYELHGKFQGWQNELGSVVANNSEATSAGTIFGGTLYKDWIVEALDRNGNATRSWNLVGCWPKTVGAIEVAADTNDSFAEFTVTLTYQYFQTDTAAD